MSGGTGAVISQQLPSGQRYLEEKMPDSWEYTSEFEQTLPSDDDWWKFFNDSTLDSLITEGTDNNYNVKMALLRIDMAKHAVGQAAAQYFPT
ncbi:MAG: hypothetical protein K2O30_00435, partial [Duncaniella sp.]|nr:hypothetical protein [Duncaniella sp.]